MAETDIDYCKRRMREERAKAEQASSLENSHIHETLARLYRIRLDGLAGDRQAG